MVVPLRLVRDIIWFSPGCGNVLVRDWMKSSVRYPQEPFDMEVICVAATVSYVDVLCIGSPMSVLKLPSSL